MASLAFDTLQFARKLTAAGVPQEQAEAQAEAMGEAFGFYVDNLVTRDYLDAQLDQRFGELSRVMDQRFGGHSRVMDQRFGELNRVTDQRFAEINSELRLHRWILGAIAASAVLPALNALFGWV